MEIDFNIDASVPVKTDSKATITSTSSLGDNFLGILAGTAPAPHAPADSTLPSDEPVSFSDIGAMINALGPSAQELLTHLNDRVVEMKVTLARVNDLLNDQNRSNVAGSLSEHQRHARRKSPCDSFFSESRERRDRQAWSTD